MTIKVPITSKSSILPVDNLQASTISITITATIKTESGDTPPDPNNDKFQFTIAPSANGNIAAATGSSLEADITKTNDPRTFIATAQVIGTAYGNCNISGHKSGSTSTWPANTVLVNVVPTQNEIQITQQFEPALAINTTPGTPATPDSSTFLEVLITDKDSNPVPELPVDFIIANVRTNEQLQTGVFYAANKTKTVPSLTNPHLPLSTAKVSQHADSSGKTTLYVGTNANAGYIDISVSAGTKQISGGYIYIFDPLPGYESPPPITNSSGAVTTDTIPVYVQSTKITPNEYIGVFLNGKFQNQVSGSNLLDGITANTFANSSDLLTTGTDKPITNGLIGRRSNSGDLINSQEFDFPIYGPLPDPKPQNQILGPMVDPNGGVINHVSIYDPNDTPQDYTTVINLAKDVTTLLQQMKYTAVAGDKIRLHAIFQGDYKDTDNFKKQKHTYDKSIAAADLASSTFNIVIPFEDIIGYGTPKEPNLINKYLMYYEYIPTNSSLPIASSSIVQGRLVTRDF